MSIRSKTFILMLVALFGLGVAGDAFARAGGGFSMGSRGSRTFSMPSYRAAPIQRSITPNSGYSRPNYNPGFRSPGFFGGGFGRGFLGGLLGAGLLGLLFGHGLFGGLGSGSSFLGLLIQLGLIYLIVRFALNYFRNRQQPAYGSSQGSPYEGGPQGSGYEGGPLPGSGFGMGGAAAPVEIEAQDYTAFERRLGEVQEAFGNEDLGALRRLATPEMVGYFGEELEGNSRRGVVNRVSGTKLIHGDLAEAWREGGAEYASVAMRFSLIDTMVDRASGRIVSGNPNVPDEASEVWTFVRPAGAGPEAWMLSAIQQAN